MAAVSGEVGGGGDTHNHSYITGQEILFDSKIHDVYRGHGNPSIYIVTRQTNKKETEIQTLPQFLFFPSPTKEAHTRPL